MHQICQKITNKISLKTALPMSQGSQLFATFHINKSILSTHLHCDKTVLLFLFLFGDNKEEIGRKNVTWNDLVWRENS